MTATGFETPAESAMLKAAHRKSGLTIADLAAATSLSTATVNIALSGIRYRAGKARVAVPLDGTLVKLATVLHIRPEELRSLDRVRAADLLEQASSVSGPPSAIGLAERVLAAFTTDELQAEIQRRRAGFPAQTADGVPSA